MRTPDPEEWHPAYDGHQWLRDWVNGIGEYADRHAVVVVFPPAVSGSEFLTGGVPESIELIRRTLVLREARGLAPYTGAHRFVYSWLVAMDELGRAICGSARPRYDPLWPCKDRTCGCRVNSDKA